MSEKFLRWANYSLDIVAHLKHNASVVGSNKEKGKNMKNEKQIKNRRRMQIGLAIINAAIVIALTIKMTGVFQQLFAALAR